MIGSDTVEVMQYDLLKKENMNGVYGYISIFLRKSYNGEKLVLLLICFSGNVMCFHLRGDKI